MENTNNTIEIASEIGRQIRIARNTLLGYNSIGYDDLTTAQKLEYQKVKDNIKSLEQTLENMRTN